MKLWIKKPLENFLKKPTVTNICKICTEIKSKNESLLASQIDLETNPAKRQKQNSANNSFPTNSNENDSNICKIMKKFSEAKCNEPISPIQNLNPNEKIALKDSTIETSNIPESLDDKSL